ncbi:hypothetical protein [Nonomuraea gerenzanensis]|uniref:hypothetical protein n=1 Tax=Nonomuraea gerenzanensis TaxID=93944 RepID=UPI001CD96469|nr:hypothetical protein [Nonomuraea gerenzanensis]UBU08444.1 hypothetical protein LCN96_29050 [Nonomuraea gerenzanensis]
MQTSLGTCHPVIPESETTLAAWMSLAGSVSGPRKATKSRSSWLASFGSSMISRAPGESTGVRPLGRALVAPIATGMEPVMPSRSPEVERG